METEADSGSTHVPPNRRWSWHQFAKSGASAHKGNTAIHALSGPSPDRLPRTMSKAACRTRRVVRLDFRAMAFNKRMVGGIAAGFMFTTALATLPNSPVAAADKPVIYLSFDDGPALDNETTRLMNVLDRFDAKATFFINGVNINSPAREAEVRRMLADGHAVANHSWQHLELDKLTDAEINEQLRLTHERVKGLTGYEMACFRSPWGTTFTPPGGREENLIKAFGYQVENRWAIDASEYMFIGDNASSGLSAAEQAVLAGQIADRLDDAVDGNVILMHDGVAGHPAMVDGVERFLNEHGDDYEFAVMPGCGDDVAPQPTPTPTPTPPPKGPPFDGPISGAASIADVLAASDYLASDADVLRIYHALLARTPDIDGTKYWLAQTRAGTNLDGIAWGFSQSAEFTQKYGALTDEQFVTQVYTNVLGRPADAAGREYWLGEVRSGKLTKHGVVRWMAESAEFKTAHPYEPAG